MRQYDNTDNAFVYDDERRPIVAAQQDGGLVERLKERAVCMEVLSPDFAAVCKEAATALAEKDAQYERLASRMDAMAADNQRLRAECEGLRAALTECALLSGLDNELIEGASVIVTARMAEIHQHSSAALSQKETGDAA